MRGQIITFDAVFAFFILVFAILFFRMIETDLSPLEELVLERRATDFVRFLYAEKRGELVLGIGEWDLREGLEKVEAEGVWIEDGERIVGVGEKAARYHTKYLLVPVFNSTEFRVVKLDVW